MTEAEYLDDTPKSATKVAKTSAPQDNPSASDMLLEDSEATEQVEPEHIIEIASDTSSSSVSLDSSDLDESTQSLIDELNKRSESAARSVPQETDSVNQQPSQHTSSYTAILQSIGELSERRVEICNKLSDDHPFHPPTIEPLNMILPEPVTETVVPASVQVIASEPSAAVTVPTHTITKTPEKATKSVPEKTELVNQQQQPEPTKQTTPEQTSTSTQITKTQTTLSP